MKLGKPTKLKVHPRNFPAEMLPKLHRVSRTVCELPPTSRPKFRAQTRRKKRPSTMTPAPTLTNKWHQPCRHITNIIRAKAVPRRSGSSKLTVPARGHQPENVPHKVQGNEPSPRRSLERDAAKQRIARRTQFRFRRGRMSVLERRLFLD